MQPSDAVYRIAAWSGIALLAGATVISAALGDWLGVAFLAAFLCASILFVVFETDLPPLFDFLFVSAAVVNAAGWVWNLYDTVWGYDEIAHFYTSFAVTLSVGYLAYAAVRSHFRNHLGHFVLIISSFGISLGAFWEIFELMVLQELTNPVVDLVMDTLGAILAGVLAAWALGSDTRRIS